MAANFDTGAFYKTGAWHGEGTVTQEKLTTAEFMKLAKMDWTVEKRPMYNEDGSVVEGWSQLRRSDSNALLHVCKDSWTPLQNVEGFTWFDPFIQDGDLYLSAAVSLKEGRHIALTAEFTKPVEEEVLKGDEVQLKLILFNSHDGSLAVGVKFTPIRVVCSNTLHLATKGERGKFTGEVHLTEKSVRIKHTKNLSNNLLKVRDQIDLARRQFVEVSIPQYKFMSDKDLTTNLWKRYLGLLFDKDEANVDTSLRSYDKITELLETGKGTDIPGVRGTMWGAYNAVTEWVTNSGKTDSILFGSYANLIERAHDLALTI